MKAKAPHLLIVSDSPMWAFPEGVSVFEPTLREIEYVTQLFPRITWIGFANKDMQRMAGGMDKTGRIQFILLPLTGGKGIKNKLTQFAYLFYYVYVILKNLRSATYVHSRAPSIPAWLVIGLSRWDKKRFYWHKYAGNWNQENPPFSYRTQRNWMAKATRTIATINGVWPDQPRHVLSFENPCFTIKEWESAVESAREKSFEGSLNFLFVGRFEHEKGILRLLEALELLPADVKSSIARVRCIGEGKDQARIEAKAAEMEVPVELIGWIGREALNKVYVDSHLLFLPSSASEGFPKVIAEAAGFGCVPCVSAVSSITQYVRHQENGWVFSRLDPSAIAEDLRQILQERKSLEVMSSKGPDLASLFTFERYCERLRNEVFVGR